MTNNIDSTCVTNLEKILSNSKAFSESNRFGATSTLCENLLEQGRSEEELLRNVNSSYPIIHHSVLRLMKKFLSLKIKHGSNVEKQLYKDMNVDQFIQRLLR